MRIHIRPAVINFESGLPVSYATSIVGQAPHKTFYIEEHVGLVTDRPDGPRLVGMHIKQDAIQSHVNHLIQEGHDPQQVQLDFQAGKLEFPELPVIPGVTTPGEWKNPRFGNPDGHRRAHSLNSLKA